jgi:sugar/nucleoside kinase (ribokinase family)
MSRSRQQVCRQASEKLSAAAGSISSIRALIGLDGFVDEIIAVVDKWTDGENYVPVTTIEAMGGKIQRAAGQSSNYELVVRQMKLGGNGPIMANALASAGLGVTYIGNLGYPNIHPVFEEFSRRAKVISIAEPAHTDALEFADGKLMLGKLMSMMDVNWENLLERVGRGRLVELLSSSRLVGLTNWTMLLGMSRIWEKLLEEVMPSLPGADRMLFVDLADPEKRTAGDIAHALELLSGFQKYLDVTLGLNLKEAGEIAHVLGLPQPDGAESAIELTAAEIRGKLNIGCVVIHPRRGAAAATAGQTARFAGPFVQQPKISTGAGDHFNAGFCLGRIMGLDLEESLCAGCATSGYYVRQAQSPSAVELARFAAELPSPEE